jgi:hypothetical protein
MLGTMAACGGGAVGPVVSVGKVGGSLAGHAQSVPQSAEVCALDEALKATPGKTPAQVTDPCKKRVASDKLGRTSLVVLGAYGEHLESLAAGDDPVSSGSLQAALTGVRGPNFADVEEGEEKAARDAVAKLAEQLGKSTSDDDLEQTVKAAAPNVKTVCDNLVRVLDKQASRLAELQTEIPQKLSAPSARRCAMLDNRPICMADSIGDHLAYATEFGRLAALESQHRDARNRVAAFCAAHKELEAAADSGDLDSEDTARRVADAVRKAVSEPSSSSSGAAEEAGKEAKAK